MFIIFCKHNKCLIINYEVMMVMKKQQMLKSPLEGKEILSMCVSLFLVFWLFSIPAFAGSKDSNNPVDPEILSPWMRLEESSTMVDVSYQVIRCVPGGPASVMLQVFNEGGLVDNIGFTLTITDNASGATVSPVFPAFSIPFAAIHAGACGGVNSHLVYDRKDLLCVICETKIKSARMAGRSTFWCPTCQPLKVK